MKAITRIWKKNPTPIIIFPTEKERNGLVLSWEPMGQHAACDMRAIMRQTRPTTTDERLRIIQRYNLEYSQIGDALIA